MKITVFIVALVYSQFLFAQNKSKVRPVAAEMICGNSKEGQTIPVCYLKNSIKMSDNNLIYEGILGQDYKMCVDLNPNVNNGTDFILLKKDSKVTYIQTNVKPWAGTVKSCILGESFGLPCFGVNINYGPTVFPKGTYVVFVVNYYMRPEDRISNDFQREMNNGFYEKRVSEVILGADAMMPVLGQCKKGDTISFDDMGREGYRTPNQGNVTKQ